MIVWALKRHLKSTWTLKEHSKTTWALEGHSKSYWICKHLRRFKGTSALDYSRHFGTHTLKRYMGT